MNNTRVKAGTLFPFLSAVHRAHLRLSAVLAAELPSMIVAGGLRITS